MIAVHPRTSLLLRRTTEAAMKKIVTSVYKAVVECNSNKSKCKYDSLGNYENGREPSQEYVPTGVPMLRYMCCLITGAFSEKSGPLSKGSNNSDLVTASARSAAVQLVGLWLVQAMLFVVKDHLLQPGLRQLLHSVQHDLCRALLVAGVSTDNAIVLSQILPTVHIVVKTASTRLLPQTFSFLKALHLDPLIRIANDLRVACSSGGQGQVLRSSVFPLPTIRSTSASQMSLSKILELCERREIILGSLLVFSTDVNFAIFCYTQYDLSRCFLPLLEHICEVLVENCFSMAEDHVGEGRAGGVRDGFASDPDVTCSLRRADALALEIIRGLLWQTSLNVTKSPSASTTSLLPLIESLVERKNQLMEFVSLFRSDAAKHGIPFLLQNALRVPAGSLKNRKNGSASSVPPLVLEDPAGGREVGACLQRLSRLLDKRALGEYLGELGREPAAPDAGDPNYATMLAEWEDERSRDHLRPGTERFFKELLYGFLEEFDFRGKSLLSCIRETSYCMCMPGEAQKIDRVMEAFSAVWMRANRDAGSDVNPFCSEKGPFILSFSLIMLNTDQHSGKLTTPMTQEDFRRMLRGSDGGNDFPDEFLNLLFDDVKAHPIIMAEMIDVGFTNDVTWALEMQMSLHDAADTLETMSRFSMQLSSMGTEVDGYAETLQPFVFRAIWRHCLTAFANALEAHVKLADLAFPVAYVTNGSNANDATDAPRLSDPIYVCNTALAGFCLIAKTSARHGVVNAVDHVILALLSQLPLDAKRSQGLVQRFGHYPFSALCLRGIFDLLRECTQDVMDAWEELGHLLSELFLLGMFTRDTQAGSEEGAIWSELHVRPRSSSFGTKRASSESGWLSALWGSSNPDSAREQEEEEQRITTHIKAFLPSMEELLCIIDSISSAGHRMVFRSLCNEVKAAISSGSCSAASCLMILITELAVRRCTEEDILERYGRLCQHVASHFFKVLEELSNSNSSGSNNITNTGGSSNIQALDISQVELSHQTSRRVFRGWTPATMRLVRAMMRAVSRFLRNAESRDASSYVLRTLMTATPSVFGAFVAAELTSGTLELLSWPQLFPEVLNSSLLSTVLESLTLAFTTCYKPPVQQNAQKALSIIVKRGLYDALASSEDIVNALVVCALKLSEIDTGDTVAGSSVSNPTPLTKSLEASMTDATLETFLAF
ncbi:Sec7 domain [Trypanosoma vivax]|nr:Sec7 domain [Trypanosoma vivax]